MSRLERLMDRLPVVGSIRAEQRRRDARAADLARRVNAVGQRMDAHAARVLKDYRKYDGAMGKG